MNNICNLNYIQSKTGEPLPEKAVTAIEVMSYMSSDHNKDGSGAIFKLSGGDIYLGHSEGRIRIKRGLSYDLIATHQRLSTSGHTADNLHPYKRDGFLLMHNGVFSGLGDKKKSDSSEYADKLQAELTKSGSMVKAIQGVHKEVAGSYSVLIYVMATKQWLYYKNTSTSMHLWEHPKYRVMSTSDDNITFAKWFLQLDPQQCTEMVVEPNVIYDLITLKELGKIEEKEVKYVYTYSKDSKLSDWDDTAFRGGCYSGGYYDAYGNQLSKADRKRWRKAGGGGSSSLCSCGHLLDDHTSAYGCRLCKCIVGKRYSGDAAVDGGSGSNDVATGEVKRPIDEDEWRDD